jgi:hypothetical protein
MSLLIQALSCIMSLMETPISQRVLEQFGDWWVLLQKLFHL